MRVKLISIGRSKGVRIPASVVTECALGEELDLRVEAGAIVLRPVHAPRAGWDAAFAALADAGDGAAAFADGLVNDFDGSEWTA